MTLMAHSWPFDPDGVIEGFGMRYWTNPPRMHYGVDWPKAAGTPVFASEDGVVLYAAYFGGAGNYVRIQHGFAKVTGYKHLRAFAVGVGENVAKGQVIGYVGTTGDSTGNHLHFETEDFGGPSGGLMDPFGFMAIYGDGRVLGAAAAGGAATPFPTTPTTKASSDMLYAQHSNGLLAAFDPSKGTYRYPSGWERAMIQNEVNAGRALVNPLGSPYWEDTFAPMLLITDPKTQLAATTVVADSSLIGALDALLDESMGDYNQVILDALAAAQVGDQGAVLEAIEKLPDAVADRIKARL